MPNPRLVSGLSMNEPKHLQVNTNHDHLLEQLRGIRRVVINTCHGGFCLSNEAKKLYARMVGGLPDRWDDSWIRRDDPYLVRLVEEMGGGVNGPYADLKIVEIPEDVDWQIEEYDGREWIAEVHRTWR